MNKGIAVWNYQGDCVENAHIFHRMGFDAVSWLGRHFDAHTPEEDERVAQCICDTQMIFTIHHRMPDPQNNEECSAFLKGIEHIAAWHDTWHLLTGLTFDFTFPHKMLMPYMETVLRTFRGSGVFIACEDTPLNQHTHEAFLSVLNKQDNFGILIDAGHMNIRHTLKELHEEQDFINAICALPVPLKEIHLSDNNGRIDEHAGLGKGTLPLAAFVHGLRKSGFDGIATIERVPRNEQVEQSRIHAKESLSAFMAQWEKVRNN